MTPSELLGEPGAAVDEEALRKAEEFIDHVHLLTKLRASIALADVLEVVKTNSSRWIHKQRVLHPKFGWQPGYAGGVYYDPTGQGFVPNEDPQLAYPPGYAPAPGYYQPRGCTSISESRSSSIC